MSSNRDSQNYTYRRIPRLLLLITLTLVSGTAISLCGLQQFQYPSGNRVICLQEYPQTVAAPHHLDPGFASGDTHEYGICDVEAYRFPLHHLGLHPIRQQSHNDAIRYSLPNLIVSGPIVPATWWPAFTFTTFTLEGGRREGYVILLL
jgi:hypothetical protein